MVRRREELNETGVANACCTALCVCVYIRGRRCVRACTDVSLAEYSKVQVVRRNHVMDRHRSDRFSVGRSRAKDRGMRSERKRASASERYHQKKREKTNAIANTPCRQHAQHSCDI